MDKFAMLGDQFLSTPSARRATRPQAMVKRHKANFYPRPPRGGRPPPGSLSRRYKHISIHALREEGDDILRHVHAGVSMISIHALREEGDGWPQCRAPAYPYFYPRPPRGGRPILWRSAATASPISIHALREEGDSLVFDCCQILHISIHALREEGDGRHGPAVALVAEFLSTPSARRATTAGKFVKEV